MQVKRIAECSKGSILQYFRPSLSYRLSLRSLFCLYLSGRLRQVLLYCIFETIFQVMGDPFRSGQLMSIHGFIQRDGAEKQVPLAFVLMSKRRKEDYVQVLRKLKDVLGDNVLEGFVLDFEPGMYNAY